MFNSNLSFRAIGLLTYLLSKPDNWSVSIAHLVKVTSDSALKTGRDAIYATIKELESTGFIQRNRTRESDGKMGNIDYIVFDQPQANHDVSDQPYTDEPYLVNTTLVNTDIKVSTEVKQNSPSDDEQRSNPLEDAFNEFWNMYPKKVSKAQAFKAWKRIKPTQTKKIEILAALQAQIAARANATGFVPEWKYPATWLNAESWMDELSFDGDGEISSGTDGIYL